MTPTVERLDLLVVGVDDTLRPDLQQKWADFESAIALPFAYSEIRWGSVDCIPYSDRAEMQLSGNIATFRVTTQFLRDPRAERNLTLLHESLHLASFLGPLRAMYEAVKRLGVTYWYVHPMAFWLGHYMYEVDAELGLAKQYPDLAADRAAYFVKIQEGVRARERATGWHRNLAPNDPLRPYYVLGDRLMAELAGLLRDGQLEKDLCDGLEEPPRESVSDIEEMHRMLSPKVNDYADLPQWGIERYEAVIGFLARKQQQDR